ncbi:MAG: pilin [Patescibacteria group bacterium]|nr:pilin [Patescibacteria group bacterium]
MKLLAQNTTPFPTCNPGQGLRIGENAATNSICNPYLRGDIQNIGDIVNIVLPFLYGIAGVILFLVIIWGGYDILFSAGNADKVGAGRMKIISGLIGFVLLVVAYLLARIFAYMFGLSGGIV